MRPVALATAPILALLLLGNAAAESRDETSARCADHSARPDLAIAACTALIEGAWGLTGHLVDDYVNRGIAYAMKRQCDQAIQDYDRAIELDHRDAVTFVNRAGAYVRQGDYDRAVQDYDQPIRLDPTNAAAFDNRGIDYGRKGEYDRAIQDFDQAIRLDPRFAAAFDNRGVAYGGKGQYNRTIQDFDEAIRLDPGYAIAYHNRGNFYDGLRQYNRAIRDFDEAIWLDPGKAAPWNSRCWAHAVINRAREALATAMNPCASAWRRRQARRPLAMGDYAAPCDQCQECLRTLRARHGKANGRGHAGERVGHCRSKIDQSQDRR